MQNKSSLQLYSNHTKEVSQENWFRNGYKYGLMMECRGNSINLNRRNTDKLWRLYEKN